MRDWNYVVDHPISLTIASDARLSPTDDLDDQVWELSLSKSEPPAISLQTTFGLRARSCRIFPRFIHDGLTINNPEEFHRPVTIHTYFPNYINLSFKPFSGINVLLEYWVPGSQTIACRAKITNSSREKCQLQVEWAEVLIPSEDGTRMSTEERGLVTILAGKTANISPVLFLTGGALPGKSPYPSLNLSFTIPPHQDHELVWAQATLATIDASYDQAKTIISKNWDTEFARILRMNSQRLEISTGDPNWNTAFYISQTIASQLLLNPTKNNSSPSFTNSRHPDQADPQLMDLLDGRHTWSNQAALGIYYLNNFLLPATPDELKGLLEKCLLSTINSEEGDTDATQGDQINRWLLTPLLSSLTWEYYQYTGDIDYLCSMFPRLLSVYDAWFENTHDRDNDMIPEWDQPVQAGFDENPLFAFTGHPSLGLDISTLESPDLSSYLYHESSALLSIAKEIGAYEHIPRLENISGSLKSMVDQSWDDAQASYLYRDRDSHLSTYAYSLGNRQGAGTVEIHRDLEKPARPIIQIKTKKEGTRPVQIYIQGVTISGSHRVEHVLPYQVHWIINTGNFTSEYVYSKIETVEISGCLPEDEITVLSSGLTGLDQTLLLPLWASIPSDEKAKIVINLTIMNKKKFLCPYGLRSYIDFGVQPGTPLELSSVYPVWMNFVCRGMVRYGERKKASELFSRMMKAACQSIEADMTLHRYYHASTGKPLGAINSLLSLMPVGLFLEILGIKVFDPTRIKILGGNPFSWPVTIKYRGLTIVHQDKKTLILFSNGQSITVDNHLPRMINLGELDAVIATTVP